MLLSKTLSPVCQLPNLDFNIETGDALLAANPSGTDWLDIYAQADKLAVKKEYYISATENIVALRAEIQDEEAVIRAKIRKDRENPGSVDYRIHFAGVFSKNGGFDLVLANPPYVKQVDIKPADFRDKLFERYDKGEPKPVKKNSDLYCYFYLRAFQLLRENGSQIFICSNTWLDVGFGVPLQHSIGKRFTISKILDSSVEKQFSSADINTIITFMTKSKPSPDHQVSFISLQDKFVASIYDSSLQKIRNIKQSKLLEAGFEDNTYIGSKWSNHLRAPDIYWKILETYKDKFTKLKSVAKLTRGITSNCDTFFYLDQETIEKWEIEEKYINKLMKSSRESKSTVPKIAELQLSVLNCTESKARLAGTNVLRYIEWGESQNFHKRTSLKSKGNRWYFLSSRGAPELILPWSINEIYRAFRNDLDVVVHQRLYECNTLPGISAETLHTLLNSTITSFMLELSARTGLGQGLLGMALYEVENVLIPNPNLFQSLPIINREIGNMNEEFNVTQRMEIDKKIFDKLGFTTTDISEFYSSYRMLVSKRLGRSISVTDT